jgi:hypothetical protein
VCDTSFFRRSSMRRSSDTRLPECSPSMANAIASALPTTSAGRFSPLGASGHPLYSPISLNKLYGIRPSLGTVGPCDEATTRSTDTSRNRTLRARHCQKPARDRAPGLRPGRDFRPSPGIKRSCRSLSGIAGAVASAPASGSRSRKFKLSCGAPKGKFGKFAEYLPEQIIGRGLRTAPGKDCCIILDHGVGGSGTRNQMRAGRRRTSISGAHAG